MISYWEFVPFRTSVDLIASNTGVYASASVTMVGPIRLPAGSTIERVTLSALLTTASAASGFDPGLQTLVLGSGLGNIGIDLQFDASPDVQVKTAERRWSIQPDRQPYVRCILNGTPDARLLGARIDDRPAPGPVGFTPVTPYRAYDSRLDMSPDANGVLDTGDTRTISLASARDVDTGDVTTNDAIPAHAVAVADNLTIAGSQGVGFLALAAGDVGEAGASAINWGSTTAEALANAGIVGVDDQRRIKIFTGGAGSTHAIVDVTGYYSA
jgi:hypothetical protein